jgi:hypothetical protein
VLRQSEATDAALTTIARLLHKKTEREDARRDGEKPRRKADG